MRLESARDQGFDFVAGEHPGEPRARGSGARRHPFVGTAYVHEHDSRIVAHAHRTITTSDGSVGHGTDTFVDNGQVLMSRITDILTNTTSGYRFRARGVFVLDLSTETVRVERFELTCLGP